MNSMIVRSRIAAAALCGLVLTALSACDSVKDVREQPATALPKQRVVVEGKVYGLGIRRSITLQNGTAVDSPTKVVQGGLGEPVGARGRETRFTFGAFDDGSAYNIVVTPGLEPYGKICVVHNGAGTVRYDAQDPFKGAPRNIEVECTDDPAVDRYDIRVAVPPEFRDAPGAKVTLMTEEGEFEQDPKDAADGDPGYVWFRDALITVPAAGVLPFFNVVTATTEEGSTAALKLVNRCAVEQHSFLSPTGTGADKLDVAVGACKFSVGGNDTVLVNGVNPASGGAVRYSRPIGVTTDPPVGAGGLVLELRYANGDPVPSATGPTTEVTITSFLSNFVFPTQVTSGASCPVPRPGEAPLPCEVRGFYDVVVKRHPDGQRCLVAASRVGLLGPLVGLTLTSTPIVNTGNANNNFAGGANLYLLDERVATGQFPTNPSNYNGLRVYCRNLPAADRQLTGTYQLMSQSTVTVATGIETGRVAWSPAYTARREFSHMLTLFADGTFLFGVHAASDGINSLDISNHVEQGFYDYAKGQVADTNNTASGDKIRFTIHVDGNTGTATILLPAGLSSTEGPRTVGTGATSVVHRVLANVQVGAGSPRTITGAFGPDGAPAAATRRDVVFAEPRSQPLQLTGTWISQDHLRFWAYNSDTNFVYHAGANGFGNIQNTCIKLDDFTAASGTYVSSPGAATTSCSPLGSTFQSNLSSLAHSPTPILQTRLPGWEGWLPGTELGGGSSSRSPSPVHFQIAPAGSFAGVADAEIFPAATLGSTAWCPTEILGIRATLNGELTSARKPIYFCRYRAN